MNNGYPLQAIKFAIYKLDAGSPEAFLAEWLEGNSDKWSSFAAFCAANPDEPERAAADGTVRKVHYGAGRQPWDDIAEFGWAAQFAAGNVLKYLRRQKEPEKDDAKARWYWHRLREMSDGVSLENSIVTARLVEALTSAELERLRGPERGTEGGDDEQASRGEVRGSTERGDGPGGPPGGGVPDA